MTRFAFLGPPGTFTEEALLSLELDGVEPISFESIEAVFDAVERGKADAGVAPIENSVEGSVNATLDALAFDTQLEIQQELILDIHHALITAPGAPLADVRTIVSHPQATGQCRKWLARNLPGRDIVAANSTAERPPRCRMPTA